MPNKVKTHSFPLSGHAHRVELLVNLAGVEHVVINLDLANGEHKQEKILKLNPVGQVPAAS